MLFTPQDTEKWQDPSSDTIALEALSQLLPCVPLLWGMGFTLILSGARSPGSRGIHRQPRPAWGWLHLCVLSQRSFLSGIHLWNLDALNPLHLSPPQMVALSR